MYMLKKEGGDAFSHEKVLFPQFEINCNFQARCALHTAAAMTFSPNFQKREFVFKPILFAPAAAAYTFFQYFICDFTGENFFSL